MATALQCFSGLACGYEIVYAIGYEMLYKFMTVLLYRIEGINIRGFRVYRKHL